VGRWVSRTLSIAPLQPARLAIRRSLIRRQIRAVAAGSSTELRLDLNDQEIDSAALLAQEAEHLRSASAAFGRLASAMRQGGLADAVADGLSSRDPLVRARHLRVAGTMR